MPLLVLLVPKEVVWGLIPILFSSSDIAFAARCEAVWIVEPNIWRPVHILDTFGEIWLNIEPVSRPCWQIVHFN